MDLEIRLKNKIKNKKYKHILEKNFSTLADLDLLIRSFSFLNAAFLGRLCKSLNKSCDSSSNNRLIVS